MAGEVSYDVMNIESVTIRLYKITIAKMETIIKKLDLLRADFNSTIWMGKAGEEYREYLHEYISYLEMLNQLMEDISNRVFEGSQYMETVDKELAEHIKNIGRMD